MRTRLTLLAAVPFVAVLASCQSKSGPPLPTQDAKAQLTAQAKVMASAVKALDHAKLADLTHPSLIEKLGGREKYIQTVEKLTGEMKQQGFEIVAIESSDPGDLVESRGEHFAITPTKLTISTPGGAKMKQAGYLVAVSTDGGRTWKFLDGAGIGEDRAKLKQLLPNFPDSLALPKREEPVIEEQEP